MFVLVVGLFGFVFAGCMVDLNLVLGEVALFGLILGFSWFVVCFGLW